MNNFQIIDGKIYDPSGQEFVIKGANMFAWEGIANLDNYLNTWGFNTIRVPNYLLGSYGQPHPEADDYRTNHKIVDAYTSQGAVVMFDAHDLIGSYYEDENWEILKDYWRDMAQEFKDNPHVWLNLHNEPGNDVAQQDKWVEYHRELIDIIRAEGANNTIVIDGEAWGQDFHTQTIVTHAQEVMAGNENIVFSIHVYDQWTTNDLGAYLDLLEAQNIPIIIGEYGSETNDNSTMAATEQMFPLVQEREIGRIVWNAQADDLNDLTTGYNGNAEYFNGTNTEILTELGQLVWDDLQRTEDLEQLPGYEVLANQATFSEGVFEVGASGEVTLDFLFDGHWFSGELALFNLDGMEYFTPGSLEFIQEAASRALSDSQQGYTLLQDAIEGARFGSSFDWEASFNSGEYLGQKTFALPEGTRFGLMLTQNNTIAEIAANPASIWQNRQMPIFSIPEANPGNSEGQVVSVDDRDIFAFEDLRVDWEKSDRDYNDIIFQLQGASAVVPHIEEWIDLNRNWLNTTFGSEILAINQDIVEENASVIKGTKQDDVLNGDLSKNIIRGRKGNDLLNGSGDEDTLLGGQGNDTLLGDSGNDFLRGGKDNDLLSGGFDDDTLRGNEGNDLLFGDSGNDFLQGGQDNDLLNGGFDNDILNGGDGNDSLIGDYGNDFLQGGEGDDLLNGGFDADTLEGDKGNDTLFGEAGNDLLQGKRQEDSLDGGAGNDTLEGGSENDTLLGSAGDDLLQGDDGDDLLNGGLDNDLLEGNVGNDTLLGDYGSDRLYGNRGDDLLDGGFGNDSLTGGKGNDTFSLNNNGGIDTILDFEAGKDKILLSDGLLFEDLTITQGIDSQAEHLLISLDRSDTLLAIVENVDIAQISLADFL